MAQELYEQGVSKWAIARRLGRHRDTIIEWLKGVEQVGLKGFSDQSQQACKTPPAHRARSRFGQGLDI